MTSVDALEASMWDSVVTNQIINVNTSLKMEQMETSYMIHGTIATSNSINNYIIPMLGNYCQLPSERGLTVIA